VIFEDSFKIVIAGSRTFDDYLLLRKKMDHFTRELKSPPIIVTGGAKGADTLGVRWAMERGFYTMTYYPDWEKFGRKAGFLRNQTMAENANALVAFWDMKSRGTAHMINLARDKGLSVKVVDIRPKILPKEKQARLI
jgi:hypothetical protein